MRINEKIEYRYIDDLSAHPRNEEFHSMPTDSELALLKQSIEQDGIQEPLWITPDDCIIAGHVRWQIAKELGMEEVPVRIVQDATETDQLYLLISSNEARRGEEKDVMRKAKKLKVLHEHWRQGTGESQTGTDELIKIAGSKSNLYRLLKLNELVPELQTLVSSGVIGQQAGLELASLEPTEQNAMYKAIHSSGVEKVRVDEIKAIRAEREKPEKEPLHVEEVEHIESGLKHMDADVSSGDDIEDDTNKHHEQERPLETVQAISKVLPVEDAKRVQGRVLEKRAKNLQKRLSVFIRELEQFSGEIANVDVLGNLKEEALNIANKIEGMF